jgi:hypothetical protein
MSVNIIQKMNAKIITSMGTYNFKLNSFKDIFEMIDKIFRILRFEDNDFDDEILRFEDNDFDDEINLKSVDSDNKE